MLYLTLILSSLATLIYTLKNYQLSLKRLVSEPLSVRIYELTSNKNVYYYLLARHIRLPYDDAP